MEGRDIVVKSNIEQPFLGRCPTKLVYLNLKEYNKSNNPFLVAFYHQINFVSPFGFYHQFLINYCSELSSLLMFISTNICFVVEFSFWYDFAISACYLFNPPSEEVLI